MSALQLEYGRGDVLASKYEVIDRLDEGPLGVWYRVRHLSHGTTLRLVLLDPKVAGREQKEAILAAVKLARRLDHPHLAKVGELGQHEGVAYVTMEDVEGPTLRELIQQHKAEDVPFGLREASQIAVQLLEAMGYLHEQGEVFRALRPEYVVVRQRRTGPGGKNVVLHVHVLGAGLWNLVPPGALAEEEFTRGEASYLAPELKGADPQASPRSDVWSVGVIYYELLCGSPPVGTYQLPRQRRPDLPAHVDAVVELALAAAPADRYASARDFAADVHRTFQSGALEEEPEPSRGTSPVFWAIAALAVLLGVVVVARNSLTDPAELAVAADLKLRKEVYDAHARPSTDEVRQILARHPPNMQYIPAGPYVSGRLEQEPKDVGGTAAVVKELPAFLIDVFEYPNSPGATPKKGVAWVEAKELCEAAGKRLCTAEEWEKACRGPKNEIYGYADAWDPEVCGKGTDDVHASGERPDCKSGWGVYDIAGNYREWTATLHTEGRAVVKGGLPQAAERGTRCAYATDLSTTFGDATLSFRCCRDVDAPPVQTAEAKP